MPPQHLEGWLWKQGAKGLVKGWKNRWFAMPNDSEIHYYQSNTSLESLGYIDMRIITSVVAEPTKKKDAKGFLFYITTPARVYHLAASTEKELNYWVDGINNMLPDKKRTASMDLRQITADTQDKNLGKSSKVEEKARHDETYSLELMAQLLQEKDTKFEALSKEASKQRTKLEACEQELALREEKVNSLMDQVQNLTSLVAHEKLSNQNNDEETNLQQVKLQELTELLEKEKTKNAELEKTIASLKEKDSAPLQFSEPDPSANEKLALLEKANAELEQHLKEKDEELQQLKKKTTELEQALSESQEASKIKDQDAIVKQTAHKELEVKWEEMQHYLKEKADQVEEWKQRWTVIQEVLTERVREDEELRAKLHVLQREHDERLAELEHFKGKWWEGKEKVDEAQRIAREREEEAEKWRLRWEELNADLKAQEESIADVGKEWDEIHKKLNTELEEWKMNAKQREDALTAVSLFLEQLCAHATEPTENGAIKEDGKEEKTEGEGINTSGDVNTSGGINSSGSITTSGGINTSGSITTSGGVSTNAKHKRKLSLPHRALQGKYEPISQRGIEIFRMLEDKKKLEYEISDLKRELEDVKRKDQTHLLDATQIAERSKEKEDVWQREISELRQSEAKYKEELQSLRTELGETMKSEFSLRQALRQSEENSRGSEETLRETSRQLRDEIELLKSELQAERVSEVSAQQGGSEGVGDAAQRLVEAHQEAKNMNTKIEELMRETKANDAAAQVLKDAEGAVMMLHAKVSHMAQDMESMRNAHAEELEALRAKLQQAPDAESRSAEGEKEDVGVLKRTIEELTQERDALAFEITEFKGESVQSLRKKVEELEEELRAKEDDFRILRQVRQGELLIKEEELRKKEAELQELRAQQEPTAATTIAPAREIPPKPQLTTHGSMSSLDLLQRSPRATHGDAHLKAKVDELTAEVKSKKEELRQKDSALEEKELEVQELRMRISDLEMEAKQREIELTTEKEMKVVELEHEMQMKVAEFEQAVRTRDFELQMKDAELRAVANQFAVVHTKNEIMRAEANELVVTREEETSQNEEEVQDLYNRLAMAEQVVVNAQNEVAQKEAEIQELRKKIELLETWVHEKETELEHLHKEKQKNKRASGQEIETLTLQLQEKSTQLEALQKKVTGLQDTININSREVVEQQMSTEVVELQKKVAKLNNELAAKDELISNRLRDFDKKAAGKDGILRQLENEREARMAQQQHILFLCQELDKLELEAKTKDAKLQTLLERISTMEMTTTETTTEVKHLRQQLQDLKENYFLSVGRSVKLQGSLVGWYVNVSLNELYDEAVAAGVPFEEWPSWITKKFQESNQKVAPPVKSSSSS